MKITIDCISDTHNKHKKLELPGGDVLIHSGDMTGRGQSGEIIPFLNWFSHQDYAHLILIPGNHDFGFEKNPELYAASCKERRIILLNESGYEFDGIKVWGSPITPWFHNWAFNRERGPEIREHWDLIPEDTEILVTHGPPHMILDDANARGYDNHVGCEDLSNRIAQTKVKLHVFGHIHEGAGIKYQDGRTYVNASSLDGMYQPLKPGYIRIIKENGEYLHEDT